MTDTEKKDQQDPQWRGYIIEHPTKGVLTDMPGDKDDKFHFSPTKPRTHDDVLMWTSIDSAREAMEKAPEGCLVINLETMEPA